MIPVEEALATIMSCIQPLGSERRPLEDACGRVLSETVVAPFDIPPADNSAMDGYAVRREDISGAGKEHPAVLSIAGDLPAGRVADRDLEPGTALRIMTGAQIPCGADTVVRQEDTFVEANRVGVCIDAPAGDNIRRAAEDIAAGDVLFAPGETLRPAHIGVLASIQRAAVSVCQRPRVAVLSTGDELTEIDEPLGPGKIVNSNSYSLAALTADAGAVPLMLGIARDTRENLRAKLQEGLNADVILTSGGVSVGDYDFVKDVLQELGLEMKFWKIRMRPGRPLAFGTIAGTPVFGLPGNPVSVMVSFEQFVRPVIRKLSGHRGLYRRSVEAVAEDAVKGGNGNKYFIRCILSRRDNTYYASSTGSQGSGILMSMARCNGLMIIPEDRDEIKAGDTVRVQILDPESDYTTEPDYR